MIKNLFISAYKKLEKERKSVSEHWGKIQISNYSTGIFYTLEKMAP